MRKLLLVGAAVMATTGVAQAQTQLVTDPVPPGVTGPFANPQPGVAPGQIAVRLNGAFNWYFGVAGNNDVHAVNDNRGNHIAGPNNKLTTTAMQSFIRLYPGFDGMSANGLRYGVAAEIRQDNALPAAASPSAQNDLRGHLYWRRAYGYIGSDAYGRIVFGSGDGPVSSMRNPGDFGSVGTGTLCGDTSSFNKVTGNPWPFFGCNGGLYTTQKLQYYSPQWAGFDFGFAWEPASAGQQSGNECNAAALAAGTCDQQSSAFAATGYTRRRNLLDMAARYRGSFGGVGLAVLAGYISSGHVTQTDFNLGIAARNQRVEGLSVGYGGVSVTFGGLMIGGSIQGGQHNGVGLLKNVGGRDQFAWTAGATYTIGPVQFGANYFESYRQGSWTPGATANCRDVNGLTVGAGACGRTRYDRGFEAAINYGIAPGLSAGIEYVWNDAMQRKADLNAAAPGLQSAVTQQMLIGGLHLRW